MKKLVAAVVALLVAAGGAYVVLRVVPERLLRARFDAYMTARNTNDAAQVRPFFLALDDRQALSLETAMRLRKTFGVVTESWTVTSVAVDGDRAVVTYNSVGRAGSTLQVGVEINETGKTSEWTRFDGEWYLKP